MSYAGQEEMEALIFLKSNKFSFTSNISRLSQYGSQMEVSWAMLFAYHIALMPLENVYIQLFSPLGNE